MSRDQWLAILLAIFVHGLVLFMPRDRQSAAPASAERSPVDVSLVAAIPESDPTPAQTQSAEPDPEPSRPQLPSPAPSPDPDRPTSPKPMSQDRPKTSPPPRPTARNRQPPNLRHSQPIPDHSSKSPSHSTPRTPHRAQAAVRPHADFRSDSASGANRADVAPSYLSHPQPDYPEEAREMGQQGVVILDVLVSAEGRAVKVTLARSSGVPDLDQAALAAARNWTFQPGRRAGVPVAAHAVVPVRFHLE